MPFDLLNCGRCQIFTELRSKSIIVQFILQYLNGGCSLNLKKAYEVIDLNISAGVYEFSRSTFHLYLCPHT